MCLEIHISCCFSTSFLGFHRFIYILIFLFQIIPCIHIIIFLVMIFLFLIFPESHFIMIFLPIIILILISVFLIFPSNHIIIFLCFWSFLVSRYCFPGNDIFVSYISWKSPYNDFSSYHYPDTDIFVSDDSWFLNYYFHGNDIFVSYISWKSPYYDFFFLSLSWYWYLYFWSFLVFTLLFSW